MAAHTKATADAAAAVIQKSGINATYIQAHLGRTDDGAYVVRAQKRMVVVEGVVTGGDWTTLTDQ